MRPGDVLGRYELDEEIGEGGMATVFRARDRELRRDVAIKVLFPHLARRDEVVRRFHREARAAAGLEHPNILRIYDVGGGGPSEGNPKELDPPFIVMELIRGRTLLQEIEQRGAILAEVTACIGALLADALGAAHAAGIIHRDIKPSNVLIAPGGRLLLADFGVARLETEDSLVTRTGSLLGTPAYMSPEQASGDTATAKSDLYSLGATLYQLSTGLLPYSGSPAKVMSQIAAGALVAPVRRSAAVGPDLSRVIERLMETEVAARPANAAAIALELRELAATGGLGDATEELAAFFADAESFLKTRTPAVVTAIVSAGKRAVAESRLPRAMALADRASALAPEDPAVKTLVEAVTEGGRSSRRRKLLALGGAGILVAAGTTAIAMTVGRGGPAILPDAAIVRDSHVQLDAQVIVTSTTQDAPMDAGGLLADASVDAGGRTVRRDAGPNANDANISGVADASVAIDAALPPADAPAVIEDGTLMIVNDTWCDITLDGAAAGRLTSKRKVMRVAPGHHVVTCSQPGLATATWTREAEVVSGRSFTVTGTMLFAVDVTIAITGDTVQIDAAHYPRGAVAKLKPGRYRAVVMHGNDAGAGGWLSIPRVASCRLHDQGKDIVCDP